jgi:hypothetical protein
VKPRLLLLVLLAALAAPSAAAAQGNPFSPLDPAAPPPTPTESASSSSADDRGLDGWQQALIFGAGVILLTGIAVAIVRDARHRAPVVDDRRIVAPPDPDAPKRKGTRPPREREKERRRETARRARAQRKRNR